MSTYLILMLISTTQGRSFIFFKGSMCTQNERCVVLCLTEVSSPVEMPPPDSSKQFPIDLSTHKFRRPEKGISLPEDIPKWEKSEVIAVTTILILNFISYFVYCKVIMMLCNLYFEI